jgi:hypothetical protein
MNAIAENFLRYEPGLVETAVFFAVREGPEERLYHRERSRLYGIADPEKRERAFRDFNAGWFARLGVAAPIEQALGEAPTVLSNVGHCLVAGAPEKKIEGAELFVTPGAGPGKKEKPTACILLLPKSLLDTARLLAFLRHELLHLTDMLDPGFGYKPALPAAEGGPTHDRLLMDRYRVLWDATIDGRMARSGWGPASVRDERLEEFARTFPMLGALTEDLFGGFFNRDAHTHADLVAFASDPRTGFRKTASPGSRCALCGFPTYDFEPSPERLPEHIVAAIGADFPAWRPSRGLCGQCAELYRAREMSLSAARELPGGR